MPISTADRLAIHELISLHGHLADDSQSGDLGELMTEDASYDVSDFELGTVRGLEALIELFQSAPGTQPRGHHVTNIVITDDPGSCDTASVRSKGLAVMPDGRADSVVYEDAVTRTTRGWRIRARKVVRVD